MKTQKKRLKRPSSLRILSADLTGRFSSLRNLCHKALAFSADGLKVKMPEISLSLVSKKTIQALNAQYRNKNRPTDVLSFGDFEIIISPEIAQLNAKEDGNRVDHEMVLLTVHGLLHLLGYDHEKPNEAKAMFRIQNRWVKKAIEKLC